LWFLASSAKIAQWQGPFIGPSYGRIPRVRRMIDWLEGIQCRRIPWFRDEFVHPGEFKAAYMGEP